jgi:hypothetical protein
MGLRGTARRLRPTPDQAAPQLAIVAAPEETAPVRRVFDVVGERLQPSFSRYGYALVAAGFGAAVLVRFWHLNAEGFNSDEAVYAGQGAAIANDPQLTPFFPVFRAHPLLFQTFLAIGYRLGGGDLMARSFSAAFGVGTIVLTFYAARLLYGRRAAVIAALLIGLMPYDVVVSRQVLLDGPMTFFATLSLFLVALYATSGRRAWLYAAGAAMGLTVLSKETSVLVVGSLFVFFALSPEVKTRTRDLVYAGGLMAAVTLTYPLSLRLAGSGRSGQNYLAWQLFRRPNHEWSFYPTSVPDAMGPAVVVVALAGLWIMRGKTTWRETLLLSWIIVPAVFFQLWPVKGFQYLLPTAPPVAILCARLLGLWRPRSFQLRRLRVSGRFAVGAVTVVVAASLAVASWERIQPSKTGTFLAGSGGIPGGRELGRWIEARVPRGAEFLAIGPSMANIVSFYGHRKAYGISVGPNPLRRNPAYEPIGNPDLAIRRNELQYLVWDAFSAARTSFFSNLLLRYADRYHGRIVHTEAVKVRTKNGAMVERPLILVYEVHG